jgi:hypothetical protein
LVFFFKDEEVEALHKLTSSYMNLNVFGPKKAIISGNLGEWEFSELAEFKKDKKQFDHFWSETDGKLTLGDFKSLVNFLITNSGMNQL